MKRRINTFFLIAFLAMLLIPVALTNTEEGAVSDADGRALLAKPEIGTDVYQAGMEAWLRDRLGLRDDLVVAHATVSDKLLGELINTHYQYGREGHTFFKLHNNIDFNSYHIYFADMVADMQRYCESRGTKFYYVFNPEKESVYRDYLPAGVKYSDEWADKMLAYMDANGVNYIDLRDALKDAKESGEAVFNRVYDAGHWSHTGAYHGMRELTKAMHRDNPEIPVLDESEYDITTVITEKIYGSNQVINAEVPSYDLKAGYEDATGELGSEVRRDSNYTYFQLIRNNSNEAGGINRLLLFEDDLWAPFAFARAKETAVVGCLQNAVNFEYYYNIFKPDVVVFENMEYVVNDNFFNLAAIKALDPSPGILANYPEENFAERKRSLLDETTQYDNGGSIQAVIVPGNAIDRIYLNKTFAKTRYAYIITEDRVIDLKGDDQGVFSASIRHAEMQSEAEDLTEQDIDEYEELLGDDEFAADNDIVLYTINNSGEHKYTVIRVTEDRSVLSEEIVIE